MKTIADGNLITFMLERWGESKMPLKELNFFGVRNFDNIQDSVWNDTLGVFTGSVIYLFKGTTDSSARYIKDKPMNPNGTAIVCLGAHEDQWCVGQHPYGKSSYTALVNTGANKKCKMQEVWRLDKEFNFKVDTEGNRIIYKGYFGCNFHHGLTYKIEEHIGGWSAGCQVCQDTKDFDFAMKLVFDSKMYKDDKGCTFSYLLLDKGEVPEGLII